MASNQSPLLHRNSPSGVDTMSSARSLSPANSDLFSPTAEVFDEYALQGAEDISGASPVFHRNSTSGIDSNPVAVAMTAGPSYNLYVTTGDEGLFTATSLDNQGYDPNTLESPTLWATDFTKSQRSSPTILEDSWLPASPLLMSTTTPLYYSPSLEGMSPSFGQEFSDLTERRPQSTTNNRARKAGPRQSKVTSDLASAARHQRPGGTSETSDGSSIRLVGRSSLETDNNARMHYLYHNAAPKADRLYHCPWEEEGCQHKPEKLKCNYEYAPFPFCPSSFRC